MSFSDLFRQAQERDEYWTEDAIISFTEQLYSLMQEQGISQSDLAVRIGASQPYVAKILRGRDNFTIATMVKLVRAVGGRMQIVVSRAATEAVPEKEVEVAAPKVVEMGLSVAAGEKQPESGRPPKASRRPARKPSSRISPDSLRRSP
jgi:transcriptional regulator with XRE-family HTH domain